jgi:predicted NAD/FAD-binding protein
MNRLQNLRTRRPVFVTLNPIREPRGEVQRFSYSHPQFDRAAVDAQARLPMIQGLRHTWFAGAWCGHGFHEDGLRSGLSVAEALGAPAPWIGSPVPVGAAA